MKQRDPHVENVIAPDFLAGGGEMGARMRALDWTETPFGLPETWPQSLRSAVSICLGTKFPIAIYWGPELALLYNDAWSPIPGEKHPWALGRPGREVWPEIWDTIGPLYDEVQSTGEGVWQQDQLLPMHRHGYTEECYFNFTFSPIRGEDGKSEGIFNAVVETTFQVTAERRERTLRELAERIAQARSENDVFAIAAEISSASAADVPFCLFYSCEADGAQARLAGIAGLDRDGPASPSLMDLKNAEAPWPLARVIETGRAEIVNGLSARFGFALPSGPWPEPVETALIMPIAGTSQSGELAGFLILGISPRRALDDEYRAFIERAAAHVATALANVRAYEVERKRAEALAEIDRAKTAFFSNVSHEFRTPLTLMLGPLEETLAAPPAELPARRGELEIVHRNSLRLLRLVNSLLDFARVEAGRVQAAYEPVDLASFTAELASTFRSACERAELALGIDCPSLDGPVHVDRDMWEKIVLNLMSNAFKFTLQGRIDVSLKQVGNEVELSVRDSGGGIPEAELPRLFERFHRVEGAQGRSYEGSGIGLALVHELVKLHGGRIEVESRVGKGTVFKVSLPLGTSHLPADRVRTELTSVPLPARASAYADEALRWLPDSPDRNVVEERAILDLADADSHLAKKRARVLLADDSADMRNYVRRLLESSYEVEAVEDGQMAIEAARRVRPDVVLTDVMMPRLDGFGLLRALRQDSALADIPVIMLSARAGEEAKVESLEAGIDDYLVKPFSARELMARVAANIKLAQIRSESALALRAESHRLETLNSTGAMLAGELDLERVVQLVTDAGVKLTGAQFGAFFYNLLDDAGESYLLHTLSGVDRSAFEGFPMPRNTAVFGPTFRGEGVVRSADITKDPRYGKNGPRRGMPEGHLPVKSYLAVPVISRTGEVLGGLFFGHAQPGVFTEAAERVMTGIAGQAAIAVDNARLYQTAQKEIAERGRAEAELRDLNETLEVRVVDEISRRREAEAALQQAQKMEAIGQLTGGIAHDFNNLLQVISGNLQLLTKDVAGNGRAEERLQNALAGVSRGAKLSSQLLSFGRRQPLEPKVINVGRLVRGLDDMLRRALGERVEIETTVAGGLWNTFVDPSQIENALLNLAINGRDAMDGNGKLTIEVGNAFLDDDYAANHVEVTPGQYVVLAVTDTGCGISPELIDKVLEPFFSTKPEGKGTGLGLSMVYGFVKQSEGHLKIYSEVGQGTTIKLYLPRAMAREDTEVETLGGAITGGSETVLVVEDDDEVRTTVVDTLSDLGYTVLKAHDAASALAVIESGIPIDLLFTDVVMPGKLRSPELARKARQRQPGIAVLFTSGYTENAIVHGGRLDEGVQLISKPYTRDALARKIRHVLANQQQRNGSGELSQVSKAPDPERLSPPATRLMVLLVEDDTLIRMNTAALLQDLGHVVVEATNAEDALVALETSAIDVLLTDIELPRMSGAALAERARLLRDDIGIVFASGTNRLPDGWTQDRRTILLQKPYDQASLAKSLQRVSIRFAGGLQG